MQLKGKRMSNPFKTMKYLEEKFNYKLSLKEKLILLKDWIKATIL